MKKARFSFIAVLSAALLLYACNQPGTTTEQQNQTAAPSQSELMKAAYKEIIKAFETGVADSLDKYVAENTVSHSTPPPGITSTGLQQLKDLIAMYHSAFSGIKLNYHHLVTDGDLLMAHGSWSATNTGPFMGMPATNKTVSNVEYIDILRFENGKFAEHWEVADNLSMMTQLGMIPAQGSAPAAVQHPVYDWNASVTSDPAKISKMKEAYHAVLAMIQSGNLANIEQYLAADFNEHMQVPGVTFPAGIEGAKQAMTMFKQTYPDLKMTVEHIAAEGDILMAHVWVEGAFSGSLPNFPPAAKGKNVKFATVDIVKFNADGKATDHWEVGDHYTEMVQLGILPAPGGEPQTSAN
ncbi:MAG TPA: ester cyclase family protein [Chitinophagales bacterium]|nr:ester cyclase family protein [Chitinophagales bacterium]